MMGFLSSPQLTALQKRTYCKDSFEREQEVHIALLCAHFVAMKKSWKIFVILFGGIKKSPYLCIID
jgi:hypothetical protein